MVSAEICCTFDVFFYEGSMKGREVFASLFYDIVIYIYIFDFQLQSLGFYFFFLF